MGVIKDAETGQRGYVITGDVSYLAPYNESLPAIAGAVTNLSELTSQNAAQRALLEQLREPLRRKLAELAETVELRRTEGLEAAQRVVLTNRGASEMDSVRNLLQQMHAEQSRQLRHQLSQSADNAR